MIVDQQQALDNLQAGERDGAQMCSTPGLLENWNCPICMDLLFKPCVNSCGHTFCFWCMHHSMNPFRPSQCPLCRAAYTHFPRVCVPLHYFLASTFPEKYAERDLENRELEEQQRVQSPDIPVPVQTGASTASGPHIWSSELEGGEKAAAITPCSTDDGAASTTAKVVVSAQTASETLDPGMSSNVTSTPVAQPYRCNNPACGLLAFRPCVLSCGCMVCRSCAPGGSTPAPVGREVLSAAPQQPVSSRPVTTLEIPQKRHRASPDQCRNACTGNPKFPARTGPQCPACGLRCTPDTRVCNKLEEAIRCLYPSYYTQLEEESAVAARAAAAASMAQAAPTPAGCSGEAKEEGCLSSSSEGPASAGEGGAGAGGRSSRRWERPPSKLPRIDALIAAAAGGTNRDDSASISSNNNNNNRLTNGGSGSGADGGIGNAVLGTSSSGAGTGPWAPSISDIWVALREELAAQADTCFTWYSVGCDDCGVFPIIGRRYRCRECTELIGYDLCGACYDRGTSARGRFNQAHRLEHRMVKVEPSFGTAAAAAARGRRGGGGGGNDRSTQPTAPGESGDVAGPAGSREEPVDQGLHLITLMNYLEVLHPELSVEQATALVMMHLGGGGDGGGSAALSLIRAGSTPNVVGGGPSGGATRVHSNEPISSNGGGSNDRESSDNARGRWTFSLGRSDSQESGGGASAEAVAAAASGITLGRILTTGGVGGGGWSWPSWMSRRGNTADGSSALALRENAFTGSPDVIRSDIVNRNGQEQLPLAPSLDGSPRQALGLSQRTDSGNSSSSCCVQ